MKIMLNFIPLKSGGGLQVGLDFINQLLHYGGRHEWYLVATEDTPFCKIQETNNLQIAKIVPRNILSRILFELFTCRSLIQRIKPDLIYTQFGPQWPGAKMKHVVGCAYSNLLYPEVDFWQGWSYPQRILKKLIDWYRLRSMLAAEAIIFETEDLRDRAIRLFGRTPANAFCIRPCVSSLVSREQDTGTHHRNPLQLPDGYKVLLVSRYYPNKNIELLPRIAAVLQQKHNRNNVIFITTLPEDSLHTAAIQKLAATLGVSSQYFNFGPVGPEQLGPLYQACDAVILPSRLESFSNSIAEAWELKRPLLISDFDWSRGICADAALYFQYDNADDAADRIIEISNDVNYILRVTTAGTVRLRQYTTPATRFQSYLDLMEKIVAGSSQVITGKLCCTRR